LHFLILKDLLAQDAHLHALLVFRPSGCL